MTFKLPQRLNVINNFFILKGFLLILLQIFINYKSRTNIKKIFALLFGQFTFHQKLNGIHYFFQ